MVQHLFISYPFLAPVLTMLIAQALKVFVNYFRTKNVNWTVICFAGGMPSSHSALVTSLCITVALIPEGGIQSLLFAACLAFTMIVLYDAGGVRRATGLQARVLNLMIEANKEDNIEKIRLKEQMGHSPIEIFAGIILGVIIPLIIYT